MQMHSNIWDAAIFAVPVGATSGTKTFSSPLSKTSLCCRAKRVYDLTVNVILFNTLLYICVCLVFCFFVKVCIITTVTL